MSAWSAVPRVGPFEHRAPARFLATGALVSLRQNHNSQDGMAMYAIGVTLIFTAAIAIAVGQIWLIIVGFQETVLWGLLMLFIPLSAYAFVYKHWNEAKKPFLLTLGGWILLVFGGAVLESVGTSGPMR
jgi:hypothetical protein